MATTLTVSELAERTGVTADTLRYYGRLGLVREAGRTPAGHRYYDETAVDRIQFIKSAQWFDIRLDEIRELLDVHDNESCRCRSTDALLRNRIAAIDSQRQSLAELREVLCRLLAEDPPEQPRSASEPHLPPPHRARPGGAVGGTDRSGASPRDASRDNGARAGRACACCEPKVDDPEAEAAELRQRLAGLETSLERYLGLGRKRRAAAVAAVENIEGNGPGVSGG